MENLGRIFVRPGFLCLQGSHFGSLCFFQFLKKRQFVYLAVRNGVCGFPKFLFEQQQEVKFRPGKGSKQTIQIMNFETKTKKFLNVRST